MVYIVGEYIYALDGMEDDCRGVLINYYTRRRHHNNNNMHTRVVHI